MNACQQGQGFGGNANTTYRADGLLGHPAIDTSCGYGSPIYSPYDGVIYKVVTVNNAGAEGYTGVFMIVDDGLECFEFVVGHCDPAVSQGQYVHKGELIGHEANHGTVFSGNRRITLQEQKNGNHEGSHRHWQKRPVMPVLSTIPWATYLQGQFSSPYRADGFYYQVISPNNGYKGCVNPLAPVFSRDLTIGNTGNDVFVLQRLLVRKNFLATGLTTGGFYARTALAVAAYQKSLGITPTSYFGPKSRQQALRELSLPPVLSGQ